MITSDGHGWTRLVWSAIVRVYCLYIYDTEMIIWMPPCPNTREYLSDILSVCVLFLDYVLCDVSTLPPGSIAQSPPS